MLYDFEIGVVKRVLWDIIIFNFFFFSKNFQYILFERFFQPYLCMKSSYPSKIVWCGVWVCINSLRAIIVMIVLQKGSLFWSTIILIAIPSSSSFSSLSLPFCLKKLFTELHVLAFGWPRAYILKCF